MPWRRAGLSSERLCGSDRDWQATKPGRRTKAIITAGSGLGWQMTVAKPGEIVGTLNVRSHQAIVSIPFTTHTYSILYKDSTNLKYNAEKQTIHENYTGWIKRLDDGIRSRLTATGS